MWIADVFGRERAEQIDFDDLALLFHRTREMDVLERPENHVILGAKGSGKSTALRALTFKAWAQRNPNAEIPFSGIYLPMSFDDVKQFRLAYDERQSSSLFEHFFVASFLMEMCNQLQGYTLAERELPYIVASYLKAPLQMRAQDLIGLSDVLMGDRHAALRWIRKSTQAEPELHALSAAEPFTVQTLLEIAERLANARRRDPAMPAKIGILLDSFDYYGLLGRVIAPLFQSDSGVPAIIKVAARTLDIREVFGASASRSLEEGRDYQVASLDRETEDEEHFRLVQNALCKRVRALGPPEAAGLNDDQIIHLLFGDSGADPGDLGSLNSFARSSSGNVLAVILLLDDAARLQRDRDPQQPNLLSPLRREYRISAVNDASAKFWQYEIGIRTPHQKHEARVFCEIVLEIARSQFPDEAGSPVFLLPSVSSENQPLITNMLASRVLTAIDPAVNRAVQCGYPLNGPVEFELNRTMLPHYDLLPVRGPKVELDPKQFGKKWRAAIRAEKPFLSPRSNQSQRDLFRADFNVFVSMPFDPAKKIRTRILRTAINRLYRERTGKDGGEGVSYTDIHFIPHVGAFRFEIPHYIREATYVVADISELGLGSGKVPGVFYEIGLAVSQRKPLALFYNCRDSVDVPPFNPDFLPTILRGQTVLVWDKKSANFYEEFAKVHESLAAFYGAWDHPLGSGLTRETSMPEGGHAYLSFQPRNQVAEEWFSSLIRQMFPELRIERSKNWHADDARLLDETIAKAAIRIIDCTLGTNSQALELGIAAGHDSRKTIEVWSAADDRRLNPVSMFPGSRFAWTELGGDDKQQFAAILLNLARSTSLGTLRP